MGNAQTTVVAYGYSGKACVANLQAQLEYEWGAKLYVVDDDANPGKRRYYIYYNKERRYVQFFKRTSDGPCKAVIVI